MDSSRADALQERFCAFCMIMAPVVLLVSSMITLTSSERWGGVLQVYALFLFIPVVMGLTGMLWDRMPRLAIAGRMILVFGCVGGIGYGFMDAVYGAMDGAGVDEATLSELDDITATGLPLILNLPGMTFPVSIAVTAVILWRTSSVPPIAGIVLAVAAICFPIGRIGGIESVIYLTDALLIVSLGWIGFHILSSTDVRVGVADKSDGPVGRTAQS